MISKKNFKKKLFLKKNINKNNNNKQKLFLKETILKNSFKKKFPNKREDFVKNKTKRVNCLCYKMKIKMISVFSKQEKKKRKDKNNFVKVIT